MKCKVNYTVYTYNVQETGLNITRHFHRLALSVKGMLAFGIFITHGIACYVAIDLVWNKYVICYIKDYQRKLLWEFTVRTIIVLITCKIIS